MLIAPMKRMSTLASNNRYHRYTMRDSVSWQPEDSSLETITHIDGLTEVINMPNVITEKRVNRSKSTFQSAAATLSKAHQKILYPVIKLLMEQVKICREMEHVRLRLSHTTDFNLADIYKIFSVNKNVTLAKHEFIKG